MKPEMNPAIPKLRGSFPVPERDHIQGSVDGPIKLLEYGDYECPYCGAAHPIVKAVQNRLGNRLCFAFRNFPLTEVHPHAGRAAQAAEAAGAQGKFWEMHDMLYEHQAELDQADLRHYALNIGLEIYQFNADLSGERFAKKVRADFRGGVRSGVNGTPTFFINELRWDGDWTNPAEFLSALQDAAAATSSA